MLYCFTHANTGFLKQFGSKSWHHFSSVSRASFRSRFERRVSTHTEAMRVHQIVTCLTLRRTPRHMQERNQVFSIAQNGPRYTFMAPKKDVLTTFSFRAKCYAFYGSTTTLPIHGRTAVTNMFAWKIQNGRFRKLIGKGLSQSVWSIVCLLPILFIHATEDDKVRRKLRLSHQFCSCCWGRAIDDVIIGKQYKSYLFVGVVSNQWIFLLMSKNCSPVVVANHSDN